MERAPTAGSLGLTLALALGLAPAAGADPIPTPTADYAADFDVHATRNGEPSRIEGRLYWTPSRQRAELRTEGHESVTIRREDKGVSWSLAPLQQTYLEKPLGKAQAGRSDFDLERELAAGNVTLSKLGRETVNGVESTRYEMTLESANGGVASGHIWLSDDDITIRIDAFWTRGDDAGHFRRDLKNLRIGALDPALFEVPAGYARFAPPAVRPALPERTGAQGGGSLIEEMQEQAIKDSNR